jgi:drug/metabolite transporter (DMT)-like permease
MTISIDTRRLPSKKIPEAIQDSHVIDLSIIEGNFREKEGPDSPGQQLAQTLTTRSNAIFWVSVWFTINVGLAVLMKTVFSSSLFKFPVLMSTVHMLVGTILSQIVMRAGIIQNQKTSKVLDTKLRYFVFLFCLNIAFGNIAVKIVNLPLSQIVRSTIPVFMMIASRMILKTVPSIKVMLSVIPIVAGVAMTVYGDIELTLLSLIILIIGNVMAALKVVITNLYLSENNLNPMVMLSKLSPLATVVMFSFTILNGEMSRFLQVYDEISFATYLWVIVSGLLSFALNWTNFLANKKTSPLTMSVLGNLKQVVLVFISMVMFNTEIVMFTAIGITIATAGMMLYSYLKYLETPSK